MTKKKENPSDGSSFGVHRDTTRLRRVTETWFQTPVPRSLKLFCFNVLKNLKRAFEKNNLDEHQPL